MSKTKKYQESINNLVSDGFTKDEATEIIDREYSLLFIARFKYRIAEAIYDIEKSNAISLDVLATDGKNKSL